MKSAKLLSAAAVIAAASLVLSGCSGSGPSADEPVALRMTVWTSNEAQLALFNEIADASWWQKPGARRDLRHAEELLDRTRR